MPGMLNAARGISFAITAHDMATSVLMRTNSAINVVGRSMNKIGPQMVGAWAGMAGGMAAVGAGIAGLGAIKQAATDAAAFGLQIERIGIVLGITGKELEKMRKTVMDLSSATEFSSTDVAEATSILAQAGFSAERISKDMLNVSLDFSTASAGTLELANSAKTLSNAWYTFGGQFRKSGKDVREMGDMMVKASQISMMDYEDLSRGIAGISGEARQFEQDFAEVLALLGAARNVGFTAAAGANAIRIALRNGAAEASNYDKVMKALGSNATFYGVDEKGQKKWRSFVDIIDDMYKAFDRAGLNVEERTNVLMKIFKKQGLRGAVIIAKAEFEDMNGRILKGADAIREMARQTRDADGLLSEVSDRLRNTFALLMLRIKNVFANLLILIGDTLVPVLSKFANKILIVMQKTLKWANAHKPVVKYLTMTAAIISALLVGAGSLSMLIFSYKMLTATLAMLNLNLDILVKQMFGARVAQLLLGIETAVTTKVLQAQATAVYALKAAYYALTKQTQLAAFNAAMSKTALGELATVGVGGAGAAVLAHTVVGFAALAKVNKEANNALIEGRGSAYLFWRAMHKIVEIVFPITQIIDLVGMLKDKLMESDMYKGISRMILGVKTFKKEIEPLLFTFKALNELVSNNFTISMDTYKRLGAYGMVGVFTKMGTALKWVYILSNLVWQAIVRVAKWFDRWSTAWKDFFNSGTVQAAKAFGRMFVDAWKIASGEMTGKEFMKRLNETIARLKVGIEKGITSLIHNIVNMTDADWYVLAEKVIRALSAVIRVVFGSGVFLVKLSAILVYVFIRLGYAIASALITGIWNNRKNIYLGFVRLFGWIFEQLTAFLAVRMASMIGFVGESFIPFGKQATKEPLAFWENPKGYVGSVAPMYANDQPAYAGQNAGALAGSQIVNRNINVTLQIDKKKLGQVLVDANDSENASAGNLSLNTPRGGSGR